ncbi:MAG: Xaa-Pro aminopeptidase [Euryarchaeota archaeon]|nr:Xaa-Pro aminopeptidase [Euryarchaeota archaeon]
MEDVVSKSEFFQRQDDLISKVLPNSLVIIPNNLASVRSNDTKYPYRANSYVIYLSNWIEQKSVLSISNSDGVRETTLYVKPRETQKEIWEGRIIGPEGVLSNWPVDSSNSILDFENSIKSRLSKYSNLYLIIGIDPDIDNIIQKYWHKEILDPRVHLDEMRSIKSDSEIDLMKIACSISSDAHIKAMAISRPGIGEWEIQASIEGHFTMCRSTNSYNPIVGGGDNSTILHYSTNSETIGGDEMVLVDAGCEVNGYASDITRTWPVSGKFTQPQRDIYELVLKAELAAIDACQAGSPWINMHKASSEVLARGLIDLGILNCSYEEALGKNFDGEYRKFFMHGTGHMLGLDVHDVGGGRQGDKPGPELSPGMVVTVEPGLYFASWRNDISVPKKYSGIGVRIEDDVLITEDGPVVLTDMCPKTIDEIESIVGSAL